MDWIAGLHLVRRQFPALNESDDPRIGSGRDDSDGGGTLVTLNANPIPSGDESPASLSTLGTTFVPVLIYSAVCLLFFLFFRRKFPRIYAPRTIPCLRSPEHPSPVLPDGWLNWIKPFLAIDDKYILNNCTLDGFLFLRFLRTLSMICLVGAFLLWPILLPIHSTGRNAQKQLDELTIGNVRLANKFYAHAIVAWLYFGFVLFTVCRECIYYINLRQAYLLSPNYSQRLSSRTVLFTCIPKPYLDEAKLRKLFGDSAKNIWVPRDTEALRRLVEDRDATAEKLQQAELRLIRLVDTARRRHLKKHPAPSSQDPTKSTENSTSRPESLEDGSEKGQRSPAVIFAERQMSILDSPSSQFEEPAISKNDPEYVHPYGLDPSLPDVRGSVAALWIPSEKRPHHRPLMNFGRRVDTIRWTRLRLKALNRDIWKLRRKLRSGDGTPLNAAFIEFDTQANAQAAFQILAHHQPLNMSPRYIGLQPNEIIWGSLRIRWWEHIMRRFFMMGAIAAGIVFWSIPSVLIGTISNIKFLSTLFFLKWVTLLPSIILDVIQGLLPALALTWLMAAVPWFLRGAARVAGVPSHALVELFVQNAYFAFQLIQVFLITTLTSTASAALMDIVQDPLSIKDVLSENLPKASNFYLSYILIQCLAAGSANLANIFDLIRLQVLNMAAPDPRRQYRRWRRLTPIHWGSDFPRFTNMGVIAISYSCIAPLVLLFAGLGMYFVSFVYRYNLIYVYDSSFDTKGLFYPRALMQLLMGLYVAEICLIGLFALKPAFGPMLLMIVFLIFTVLVHISLNDAVKPLLSNLPRTLALERELGPIASDGAGNNNADNADIGRPEHAGGLAANYYDSDEEFGDEANVAPPHDHDTDTRMRGVEGTASIRYAVTSWVKAAIKGRFSRDAEESGLTRILAGIKYYLTPDANREPNLFMTFLHPEVYQDFRRLQPQVNPEPADMNLPDGYMKRAYWPPEMWMPPPKLWIPKDEARVSRQEVAHTKDAIPISDEACWLNEKGRVVCDHEVSPLYEPRVLY